jgi:hypothetical protein
VCFEIGQYLTGHFFELDEVLAFDVEIKGTLATARGIAIFDDGIGMGIGF